MNALSNSAASAAVSLRIFVVLSFVQMVLGVMATFATSQDVGLQTAAVVPGIALLVLIFSLNLVGDRLRTALDPKRS